jgi:predicted MPP superfamily phosphohydrolase
MWHHWTGWLRRAGRQEWSRRQLAQWIGQNWARVSYGRRVEPTWLELNRPDIPVQGLPSAFDGFRIAQLSDLHCSRQVIPSYLSEAVELTMAQQADLIVLTGDFIHHGFHYVEHVAAVLSGLRAPGGVFAVLGNHDFSVRNALGIRRHRHLHRAVADALVNQGIQVLRNEAVPLLRDGQRCFLIGLDDLWSRRCDLETAFRGLDASIPHVVLAHNPRTIEKLDGRRCDLMLSGHTHGGQVNWPGLGRVTLGRKARRFAAGLYRYQDSYLYVNKGVGFGFRFRFGVRPEVAVLTLRQA